jgi:hypothetical protein
MQVESTRSQVEDVGSRDIGGHEVRRALDPLESQSADTGQGFHRKGFGEPRNSFDNRIPAADQHQYQLVDKVLLANDDFRELLADVRGKCRQMFHYCFFS